MKLIESKVELIEQMPGLEGVYQQIEFAGRTCYKSEDKITGDNAKEFVDRMIKSNHGAMLEHGAVYLCIPIIEAKAYRIDSYNANKYSKTQIDVDGHRYFVTTNLRVLVENNWLDDLKYICEPTEHHEKRITARFTCDRGVSHEIVRHRTMSFAQESTRYCNYSKDKFDNHITFVKPSWYNGKSYVDGALTSANDDAEVVFLSLLEKSEQAYMQLIEMGWKPQQARQVLPNALKTEIVVTGFESDWEHFFSLRSPKAGAQGVHPDMAKLADELYEKLNNVNNDNKIN